MKKKKPGLVNSFVIINFERIFFTRAVFLFKDFVMNFRFLQGVSD